MKCPTCCTFGGAKLDRLYVTSMKEEGEGASEHWGGLFSVAIPGEFGMAEGGLAYSQQLWNIMVSLG